MGRERERKKGRRKGVEVESTKYRAVLHDKSKNKHNQL